MSATAASIRQPAAREERRAAVHVLPAPADEPLAARRFTPPRPRAVLATVSLLVVLLGAAWLVGELGRHPVDSVRIAAEFRHLDRVALESAVQPHLSGSFFAVDVEAAREAARSLPWVREVSVRRVWPGSIHIAIVEREAAYRWSTASLLEEDATLFTPAAREGFEALPQLDGPPGSEEEVAGLYRRLEGLMAPLRQRVSLLEMSARGAWRAELASGIELVLGRDPGAAALERLVAAFPAVLAGQVERIEAIDLRYANGFAVRWKPAPDTEPQG